MRKDEYYYLMPFYKKALYTIADFFSQIKNIKISWKKLLIFFILILVVVGIFLLVMNQKKPFPLREPYNKENFIEAKTLDDKIQYVMENDSFKIVFDYETNFVLTDKRNQMTYLSSFENTAQTQTKDLFNITYLKLIDGQKIESVYEKSIKLKEYAFRLSQKNNAIEKIEVLYRVGENRGIVIDGIKYNDEDFPKKISTDNYEEIISNLETIRDNDPSLSSKMKTLIRRMDEIFYTFDTTKKDGYVRKTELTTTSMKKEAAEAIYIYGGYTKEKLADDNKEFGNEHVVQYPYFEFSVCYQLNEQGLEVEIINDSIVENEAFPLLNIDVLPNFGAASLNDNGYIVLPDGSGALINFDNNKYTSTYSKRLYGTDSAMMYNVASQLEKTEKIAFPMYGLKKNGYSFINVIENGASMCELNAGFKTLYDGSGNITHKLVTSNYKYFLREIDSYKMSESSSKVNIWANEYNRENLKMSYLFLEKENTDYNDMAQTYRSHLIDRGILTENKDQTQEAVLNVTLLGSYLEKKYFLGIPYKKSNSLTNVEQAKKIVDELLAENISELNIIYNGFSNHGLKPYSMNDIDFERSTGSRKDFQNLEKYLNEKAIDLYLDVYALTGYTDKNMSVKNDSIHNLLKKSVPRYPFDPATFLPNKSATAFYSKNSKGLNTLLKDFNQDLYKKGFKNLSYSDLGNELNSTFKRNNVEYRIDAEKNIVNYLQNENNQFNQIFRSPNDYVLPYAKFILDLPSTGTNLPVIDTLIPFVQLVLSGTIDYSGEQINLQDQYSLNWHKLRAIETGSNLSFTWSYENTIHLVETEYNYYYSTFYKNSLEESIQMYHELNALGIYQARVIKHEIIQYPDIVRVTYSNGMIFEIDYQNQSYTKVSGGVSA